MILSHRLKCIFIHIQKTGGSSIEHALTVADPEAISTVSNFFRRHVFARELQAVIDPEIWSSYFKFAFVRNPWERLVSWHAACLQRPSNAFQRHIFEKYPDFDDFIEHATEGMAQRLTFNQLDYICNVEGDVMVDFIGRMEKFEKCHAELCKTFKINIDIPHLNTSDHKHYRYLYNNHTREIVSNRFWKDIAYFGYRF